MLDVEFQVMGDSRSRPVIPPGGVDGTPALGFCPTLASPTVGRSSPTVGVLEPGLLPDRDV